MIQPLFLDELREELDTVIGLSDVNRYKNNKAERLSALLDRISKIKAIDPTCGSGNFLIIAYKELRKLEIDILKAQRDLMKDAKDNLLGFSFDSVISLNNFYGIEYDDFASQIARLSLWLAEHQMNVVFEQELGSSQPMLPLKDSGHIVHGNSLRLDWNDVCPNNGSDEIYVIGNPPFGGKSKRSASQIQDMEMVFKGFKKIKTLDYVACWFYKGALYIKDSNASLALVTTNSVSQGEQVAILWPPIFELGLSISFAYQTFQWKNNAKHNAGVHVIVVGLSNKKMNENTIYKLVDDKWHKETVKNISPYLVAGSNIVIESRRTSITDRSSILFGNMPYDGGNLLLTREEKDTLISNEPKTSKYILKLLGASEFLNSKERYCLWLANEDLDSLMSIPELQKRINAVKAVRLASSDEAAHKLAERPHEFRDLNNPDSFILVPRVSSERRKYIPIGFFKGDVISTDANQIIPNGTLLEFGFLTSVAHNDWMRLVAGRLESRYRYSGTIVYNTFPLPDMNDEQKQNIEHLAEGILLSRATNVGMTLAELYDPDKMPDDLRQAHANLDDAVDKLYRPQGFITTEERLAHLLSRYEKLIESEKSGKSKKKN